MVSARLLLGRTCLGIAAEYLQPGNKQTQGMSLFRISAVTLKVLLKIKSSFKPFRKHVFCISGNGLKDFKTCLDGKHRTHQCWSKEFIPL